MKTFHKIYSILCAPIFVHEFRLKIPYKTLITTFKINEYKCDFLPSVTFVCPAHERNNLMEMQNAQSLVNAMQSF